MRQCIARVDCVGMVVVHKCDERREEAVALAGASPGEGLCEPRSRVTCGIDPRQ